MFNRIYIGIFLSVVLAILSSYTLYSISYTERQHEYRQQVLSGPLQLILDSLQQQPLDQRQAYLDIVSRLFGAELTELSAEEISALPMNVTPGSAIPLPSSSSIQWLLPIDAQSLWRFRIAAITEQQFRAHALLFVAELSRNADRKTMEALSQYSGFPLATASVRGLQLDAQQRSRLRRGSVVVAYDAQSHSNFSVYAPLPNSQPNRELNNASNAEVVMLGPIEQFDPLPMTTVLMMVAATILVIVIVSGWLVFRMDQRLRVITSALKSLGAGDIDARVELSGNDHISALGGQVNEMSDRLAKLLESQRHIMQAVSHELRTPLARVRFRLEMLETELKDGADNAKIAGVKRDLGQLEALIDEVLEHHRLSQAPTLDFQQTDIRKLLQQVCDDLQILFPGKSIELQLRAQKSASIHPASFNKLVQNLIGNACKHAQSSVFVTTEDRDSGYLIQVEDDGPGIAPEDQKKIFDAFYRADKNTSSGYGLGLAIAARVAELHNSHIELSESSLGGACFRFVIPANTKQEDRSS